MATKPMAGSRPRTPLSYLRQWFDSDYFPGGVEAARRQPERFEWPRAVPFLVLHLGCLGVIAVGWSWFAVAVAVLLYLVRMFAITGFYHRYFSHRSFSTSRVAQFLFAVLGNTAIQRGALWWASVHRHHHRHSDQPQDMHSPANSGFWWAHIGWMTTTRNFPTDYQSVRELARFPELRWLNRFDLVVPALFGVALYAVGAYVGTHWPKLGTSGGQLFVWGFFVSTVVLLHATLSINSLAHVLGRKRFQTEDDSRNSLFLALITLGEGWHNNHHHYMGAARQGFYWWEIDVTYYVLKFLSWIGVIWDLKPVPERIYLQAAQPKPPRKE